MEESFKNDPVSFIKNNMCGFDIESKYFDKMEPTKDQVNMIQNIHCNKNSVFCGSRQIGLTSALCQYIAWKLIHVPNQNILFLCNNISQSKMRKEIINDIIINCNEYIENNNSQVIKMKNGSSAYFLSASRNSIFNLKKNDISHVFVDDAAFIDNLELIYNDFIIHNKNANFTMTSCQQYTDSFFNKKLNDEEWLGHVYMWYDHPIFGKGRYEEGEKTLSQWYNDKSIIIGDKDRISMELDCIPIDRPKKTNKGTKVTIRIDDDLRNEIGKKLIEKDVTISQYIRGLIDKDIN